MFTTIPMNSDSFKEKLKTETSVASLSRKWLLFLMSLLFSRLISYSVLKSHYF